MPDAPPPTPTFTPEQRERGKRTIVLDGIFAKTMDTLTSGVFLAGLGVYLGASNSTIGVLASLPFLAQVAQVVAVKLLLQVTDRRKVVVVSTGFARASLLGISALVLWLGQDFPEGVLLGFVAFAAAMHVVSTAAWNWWMRDLIPREELGRYFGRRLAVVTLIGVGGLLAAGALLDLMERRGRLDEGYATLYFLGFLAGATSTIFLAVTPHVTPGPPRRAGRAVPLIARHIREPANRILVAGLMLAAAALTFSLPFTAVYLLRSLGYGYVTVTILAVVSQLAYVSGLRAWGTLSDQFGNRPVLLIAYGMLVVVLLGWAMTSGERGLLLLATLGVLHFLSGFAVGGIELSTGNLLLKLAPTDDAPSFLAAMNLTKSLAAGAATIGAGLLWQWLGTGEVVTFGAFGDAVWSLRGFHVLNLAAAALALVGLLSLRWIPEPGVAPVARVAKAMRLEVHQLSSIAGIRAFVHVVSYVVEAFVTVEKPRRRRRRTDATGAPTTAPASVPDDAK